MFVAVDGPNGVGKTSAISALDRLLRERGLDVLLVRQPSETHVGRFVRHSEQRYRGLPLAALVVADRIMQIDEVVRPALADGKLVVSDRHIASTLALQRIDGVDLDVLWQLNDGVLMPDLSVFLSAPPAILFDRLNERGRTSRFEQNEANSAVESQFFAEAAALIEERGHRVLRVSTAAADATGVARIIDGGIRAIS